MFSTPEEFLEELKTDATLRDGVYYWKSNDRTVPPSCWTVRGLVPPKEQEKARDEETAKFLAKLRANPQPVTDEEAFEMRAAFGPGVEVVNILTGKRFKT